jgi:hypothetical protein
MITFSFNNVSVAHYMMRDKLRAWVKIVLRKKRRNGYKNGNKPEQTTRKGVCCVEGGDGAVANEMNDKSLADC